MVKQAAILVAVPTLLMCGWLTGCGARGEGAGAGTGGTRLTVVVATGGTPSTIGVVTMPRKLWTAIATTDAVP